MRRCTIALFSLCSIVAPAAAFAVEPETRGDRFDIASGAVVTAHSEIVSSLPEGMFGAQGGAPEPGVTFFLEGPAGTIHFIEWSTPAPVLIEGFNLRASGDLPNDPEKRTIDHFTLEAKVENVYVTLYDEDVASPYQFLDSTSLVISTALDVPVLASEFRAEMRQHLEGGFYGPRIYELDGFGGEKCGDANRNVAITSSDALFALRTSVGSSFCAQCVCDVDSSGGVVASDALAILRSAVGAGTSLECPVCFDGQQ